MPTKGQAQIIQFILFFMIGLALFLTIGGVFRGRLDFFAEDIADANRRLIASHFSALSVQSLVSCKGCDNFNTTVRLVNTTAGSFTQIEFNETRLIASSLPGGAEHSVTAHNLIAGVPTLGKALSNRPIILSYSEDQNILELRPGR